MQNGAKPEMIHTALLGRQVHQTITKVRGVGGASVHYSSIAERQLSQKRRISHVLHFTTKVRGLEVASVALFRRSKGSS